MFVGYGNVIFDDLECLGKAGSDGHGLVINCFEGIPRFLDFELVGVVSWHPGSSGEEVRC